jgi:hypothetical protein
MSTGRLGSSRRLVFKAQRIRDVRTSRSWAHASSYHDIACHP